METYETFYASDFGGSDAALGAAVRRYSQLAKDHTAVVAAVESDALGFGFEIWATTQAEGNPRPITVRVYPNGTRYPTFPPRLVDVLSSIGA